MELNEHLVKEAIKEAYRESQYQMGVESAKRGMAGVMKKYYDSEKFNDGYTDADKGNWFKIVELGGWNIQQYDERNGYNDTIYSCQEFLDLSDEVCRRVVCNYDVIKQPKTFWKRLFTWIQKGVA